jgi:AraC-like DNA-binding protein
MSCLYGIRKNNFDSKVLLARAGINPTLIEQTTHRTHTDQVARLFRSVQQELNDEFMGFTAEPCKYGIFETFCELSNQCKTLGELLEKMVFFYGLITESVKIKIHIKNNDMAELQFSLTHPELDPEHFLAEWLLVIWHRFSSWYIAKAIRLKSTSFNHEMPPHLKELQIMFPGNLLFKQPYNSICFDASYLTRPLVRTNRELNGFTTNHPAEIMTIPGGKISLESQIERMITQECQNKLNFPKVGHLSEILGLSTLMLYRRLKDEGTSYQKIKDNMRRELAISKLVKERLSVEEVSEIVGFAEPRSFTRAFKHWTGLTPRNYCKYQRLK